MTVDEIEIAYDGDVGEDTFHVDLHPSDEDDAIIGGAFVGTSADDLAVDETHEDVEIEIVETRDGGDDETERVDDVIDETDTFFAMPHLGEAGEVDGERVPGLQPALTSAAEDEDELSPVAVGDEVTIVDDLHESGVSQELFDAVAGDDGDLEREDVRDLVDEFLTGDQEIDGVAFDRTDVRNLVEFLLN